MCNLYELKKLIVCQLFLKKSIPKSRCLADSIKLLLTTNNYFLINHFINIFKVFNLNILQDNIFFNSSFAFLQSLSNQ